MKTWTVIKNIFKPVHHTIRIKIDLVFLIFYAIIVWRVCLNLFTSAGYLPFFWQNISFWFTGIIWNMLALFGLVWLFRIYVRSLKHKDETAVDILGKLGQIPFVKTSNQYKELCHKYQVEDK